MKGSKVLWILLGAGILLLLGGLVCNPTVLSKFAADGRLSPARIDRLIGLQVWSVHLGFGALLLSLVGLRLLSLRTLMGGGLLILVYGLLLFQVYVRQVYPDHLVRLDTLPKLYRVLTGQDLVLSDYEPRSALVLENRQVPRARFPVIDIHNHLCNLDKITPEQFVRAMDACNVRLATNLDVVRGPHDIDFKARYPDRTIQFTQVQLWDEGAVGAPGAADVQVRFLENEYRRGARGVKFHKNFGFTIQDTAGVLLRLDDPRLNPLWKKCAELRMPVLMHTGDPAPFAMPVDRFNERFEELRAYPKWSVYGPRFPKREELFAQRENLLRNNPETIFIGAHFGCNYDDLSYLGRLLDTYPNFYVDTAAVMNELGRQPYRARKFIIAHQDKILFGTDGGWGLGTGIWTPEKLYQTNFEFFETENEYFDYQLRDIYNAGRWKIYGLNLPDDVLEKLYHRNAEKILGIRLN